MSREFHQVKIGSLHLALPIREVAPGVRVALFNPLGDWRVCEAAGEALARLVPTGTEALLMPDGKAQAILHVMGRLTGLPTVVARKSVKPYMKVVARQYVTSITTRTPQELMLTEEDAALLRGKSVVTVDDVVSTGASDLALQKLLTRVGALHKRTLAVFTEGAAVRPDVVSLGFLPLF
ncbi:MAG: hypothetical protein RLZZ324_821 [Candidatus Parcubacteria bacterium]|jgi:adenine phosphoribosyltransferase